MSTLRAPAPRPRVPIAAVLVLGLLVLAGLTWAKWWPYAGRTGEIARTDAYPGSSILDSAGDAGAAPSLSGAWSFLVDYTTAIWPALLVALVLAAALQALLPAGWLANVLRERGRATTAAGAAASLPGMMCSCCCAPLAATLRREGAALPAVLAFWVGNPLLNPAVLVFLALLAPWQWLGVRVVVGLVVVLGVAAVVGRLGGGQRAVDVGVADARPVDLREAPARFARAFGRLVVTLVPEYLAIVFVIGLLRGWLFPFDGGDGFGLLLLAAVAGTLVVIPTAGEVPILLGLTAVGAGAGVVGALLITLPALSLPSMAMVARDLGTRATVAMGVAVAASGVLAGGLLVLLA